MDRIEYTQELRKKGYSCSQAVLCAYCDLYGLDHDTAYKLAEGFSAGFGGRKELCGAVSAMGMVIGLKNSAGNGDSTNKPATLKLIDQATEEFIAKNNTHMCAQLKEENTETRTCSDLIKDCAILVEKYTKI